MNLLTIIGEALRALRQNRLRTGLTMLGMIIGVAAVVLMLSIGQGARTKINETIAAMGSNLFLVVPGATSSGGFSFGSGSVRTLTINDAYAIAELPSVSATAPVTGLVATSHPSKRPPTQVMPPPRSTAASPAVHKTAARPWDMVSAVW